MTLPSFFCKPHSTTNSTHTYTEKLSRKALFSAGVTGTEGFLSADGASSDDRSIDKETTSFGSLYAFLSEAVFTGIAEVSVLC